MVESLQNLRVNELISRFAADRPLLPAGGSASALLGAVAAAMGAFVAAASHRHAENPPARNALKKLQDRFGALEHRFLCLMEEDVRAYARDFLGPPVQVFENGMELMEICRILFPMCHAPARADFQVVLETAAACIRSAAAITSHNAGREPDKQKAADLRARIVLDLEKARQIQLSLDGGP